MNEKERALAQVAELSAKIERGETSLDSWKWKRAEAMAAATDAGATQREIAQAAGFAYDAGRRESKGVQRHIAVARQYPSGVDELVSWQEAYDAVTGFDREAAQDRTDRARTRRVLSDASLEQVEAIVADLPPERRQAIAAAAGNEYAKARQDYDDRERTATPGERREREQAQERITRAARQATGDFVSLGIIGHLEQATDELRELTGDASLTPDAARRIEAALDVFTAEFTFAKSLLGEGAA